MRQCSVRKRLRSPPYLFSAPPSRRRLRLRLASAMPIQRYIAWVRTTSVTVVRRLVAHLAVTLVYRLALPAGQRRMAGDECVRSGRGRCALYTVGGEGKTLEA